MEKRWAISFLLLLPLVVFAQEVCNNGIDDNGDGLIDLNDPECECATLINPEGTPSFIVNHSFEQRDCCPFGFSTPFQNWLDCATAWNQATSATSDYYHECGFSPATFPLPPPDGEGSIGFISTTGYKEYVGACLTFPGPPNPLQPGISYTLSLWMAGLSISNTNFIGEPVSNGVYYEGAYPLALFGSTNCVPFPLGTTACVGDLPGWFEIARVVHQPNGEWAWVSMTFTPSVEIRSVILGPACDIPSTYVSQTGIIEYQGQSIPMDFYPYTLVDQLTLTEAQDQILTPVSHVGHVCTNDVVVTANPPVGATGHQWYLNGVAIVGQTGTTLNASALGLGAGTYALTSTYDGQCLMGTTNVPGPIVPAPLPVLDNVQGCAPLTVSFADTTGIAVVSSSWDFGDGTSAIGDSVVHTYTSPGTYDVTLRVTTSLGCVRDSVLVGAVVVWSDPLAVITATPNPGDADDPLVLLSGSSSTGGVVSWWWDLGAATPGSSGSMDVPATFPSEPGSYPVVLVVENANGCVDTVSTIVVLVRDGDIRMPNVFSPNGDGGNDVFVPLEYTGAPGRLEIYNRWGQLLYSTTDLGSGWDGKVNGSEAPAGTYYYLVDPTSAQGERSAGHVTLLR
jgi:gliding motility-associated-like protein